VRQLRDARDAGSVIWRVIDLDDRGRRDTSSDGGEECLRGLAPLDSWRVHPSREPLSDSRRQALASGRIRHPRCNHR